MNCRGFCYSIALVVVGHACASGDNHGDPLTHAAGDDGAGDQGTSAGQPGSGGAPNGDAGANGRGSGGGTAGAERPDPRGSGGDVGGDGGASGAAAGGGSTSLGGRAGGGGTMAGGGRTDAGGNSTSGGRAGTGGNSGGNPNAGGSAGVGAGGATTSPIGSCSRPVGSCSSPAVQVTEVSVESAVTRYGQEGDTEPLPMAIAAIPSGGSRLAWLGTDGNVYVGQLDCDDKLVGTPFKFPAKDLQDVYADDNGGVVLLTRDATHGGTDNCGTGQLCGGSSSPCSAMYMVRFDNSGTVSWTTQVTNLSDSVAGYTNGARFVWWYQHHGRLASDGTNIAAYHGVAITVANGSCVDIHEGDRMQVVSSTGALLSGHDSFEVGCSHAWTSRIVWDPRTGHFVMVCSTDNNCRIAQPNPYRTVAVGTCDNTLFGGDLVLASTTGYWTAWSQSGTIRLEHFTTGASDQTISNAGSSAHPHLVSYGPSHMLLAWGAGSSMAAQVRDSGTGAAVGSQFTIDINDHSYQAFKAYPDGSVAYPASGGSNTSIKIARVMPCD